MNVLQNIIKNIVVIIVNLNTNKKTFYNTYQIFKVLKRFENKIQIKYNTF